VNVEPSPSAKGRRPKRHDQLLALARFAPIFCAPDFRFTLTEQASSNGAHVFAGPGGSLSPGALAFVECAYESGWVKSFDWADWLQMAEAQDLANNPEAMAAATHDQLAKVLTALIRQDRFDEGALNSAFQSGLLTAIVQRAEALLHDRHSSSRLEKMVGAKLT
jgi:hypothetical protein